MKKVFAETLCEIARYDPRVWLLTGDLGYSVLERFAGEFPQRYVNVGVAEQNMVGVAAGLAMTGKVVFVYSIANFSTLRCLEQIRQDVVYHRLDVKVVAVGCGLTYGGHGYSHHGVEDVGVMSLMPHMDVVVPGDEGEVRWATRELVERDGPAYLRLGKSPVDRATSVYPVWGHATRIRTTPTRMRIIAGNEVTLVATGAVLDLAVRVATVLAESDIVVRVFSMPVLSRVDEALVVSEARRTGRLVTLEEHGRGGLGTMVGECLALAGLGVQFMPLRTGEPTRCAGSREYLMGLHGLTVETVVERIRGMMPLVDDGLDEGYHFEPE